MNPFKCTEYILWFKIINAFFKDCQREITPGYIYKRQDDKTQVTLTDEFWDCNKIVTPKYYEKSDVCKD